MGSGVVVDCTHPQTEEKITHVCLGSVNCTPQYNCFGGDNALLVKCVDCGTVLEDWDYSPRTGRGKRIR